MLQQSSYHKMNTRSKSSTKKVQMCDEIIKEFDILCPLGRLTMDEEKSNLTFLKKDLNDLGCCGFCRGCLECNSHKKEELWKSHEMRKFLDSLENLEFIYETLIRPWIKSDEQPLETNITFRTQAINAFNAERTATKLQPTPISYTPPNSINNDCSCYLI